MKDLMEFAVNTDLPPQQAMGALVDNFQRQTPNQQLMTGMSAVDMNNLQRQQNLQAQRNASGQLSIGGIAMPGQMGGQEGSSQAMGPLGMTNGHDMSNTGMHMQFKTGQVNGGINIGPGMQGQTMDSGMMHQISQQGTNSSGASVETSPRTNSNKWRRSQIKTESDDANHDGPGPRVKASPRGGSRGKE